MLNFFPKSLKSFARQILERIVERQGYVLKIREAPLRGPREFFAMISRRGHTPATVFDIGVGYGTQWLYDAFPKAYFVLVEANREFEASLIQICERYRGEYHILAAGAENATGILHVNRNFMTSSGLVPLSEGYIRKLDKLGIYRKLEAREVPIRPLNSLLNASLKQPFLIKLDIEGFEAEVLRGAAKILPKTELIVTEISIQNRFQNELRFTDFVVFMDKIGFDFFDIINLSQTSVDGSLAYMDAVFVNRKSELLKIML